MPASTPKSVIMAVVLFLGVFALFGLAGVVFLIDQGKASGAEIALVSSPTVFVLGVLGGLLGNTRTTPELPAGAVLQTGETKLYAPDSYPTDPGGSSGASPLTSLVEQGIDPAQGTSTSGYPRNANADPA